MTTELDLGWFDPSLGALQRRESTGVTTGLSRAVAERLGIDAVLVRVVFVVLAFCGGLGLALYAWGTVLTRGPQGTRPVDQVLPGFRDWRPLAQKLLVIGTSIALVATIGSAFPLPWGAGVLVLIVLALMRRRALRPTPMAPGQYPPPPFPGAQPAVGPVPNGPVDDQFLVDQWRSYLTDAVGTRRVAVPGPQELPEVDLYAPEEPASRPVGPQPKAGWWGGLAILAAMGGTATLASLVFGLAGPTVLALTSAVGGLGAVLFALIARHRRIPRPILALLAVPIVAMGWLATQTSALASAPVDASVYTVRVVADDAVVDLRDVDLNGYIAVKVDALMSDVEIIVPAPFRSTTVTTWAGDVHDETTQFPPDETVLDLELQVSARMADVVIKESA